MLGKDGFSGLVGAALILLLAACSSGGAVPTAAPTEVLIPAAPTLTPTPTPTPTPTVVGLPSAAEIALTLTAESMADSASGAPEALEAAGRALLQESESLDADAVRFVEAEAVTWRDSSLECRRTSSGSGTRVDGYRLTFIAGDRVYEIHTDSGEDLRLCREGSLYDDYPTLFLEMDPIAAETVQIARERAAAELDLSQRLVDVVSVRPVVWPDTSLGCPLEGQSYDQVEINGYRIVLEAGEQTYYYHADFNRLVACEEGAVLPSTLRTP